MMAQINPKYVGGTLQDLKQELDKVPGYSLQQKFYRLAVALGQFVTQMRKAAGFTQAQLGERMGAAQPFVARLESDHPERIPTFATIGRAANACGYDMEVILRPRNRRNEVLHLNMNDYVT
jgi:hypothetical protein